MEPRILIHDIRELSRKDLVNVGLKYLNVRTASYLALKGIWRKDVEITDMYSPHDLIHIMDKLDISENFKFKEIYLNDLYTDSKFLEIDRLFGLPIWNDP